MNLKCLSILFLMFASSHVLAEKIDIKIDSRNDLPTSVFTITSETKINMGWFNANTNKERLLVMIANKDKRKSFKDYVFDVDNKATDYEDKVFVLPANVLTLSSGGDLYSPLMDPLYYSTYFK